MIHSPWLLAGLGSLALMTDLRAAETTVPVTVVNYSKWPVHATAITLNADQLCRRLGAAAGTPLAVRRQDGAVLPLLRDVEAGAPVVRVLAALPPLTRLDLVAERAAQWNATPVATASTNGALDNGIVHFAPAARGWQFGLAADHARLIEDGALEFWVDNQNRGRISNGDKNNLIHLGLAPFSGAKLESSAATFDYNGLPTFVRRWRLGGIAQQMTCTETFALMPGRPLLLCRVCWENDGDTPLWIAYTGSGDGVRGKWSKDLMPTPLIERKKSPIMGDLNGGETRCAWVGGLCRISMESPATGCGVGLSTAHPTPGKVGQGSMVWGCSGSGFQCNFIDPNVGQFPFRVKPHDMLNNGFVFLAEQTGVSVHRETVALWKALQSNKIPPLIPPCAIFVGGEPVAPQTVAELSDAPALWLTNGAVRQAALRMDLNKHFECRVSVEVPAPNAGIELTARRMASSQPPITLLRADQSGTYAIDLNMHLSITDEVAFVLEARSSGAAQLKSLVIVEMLPVAPEVFSPLPDASFMDIATMFRWKAIPMVVDYDLQLSRAADFSAPVATRVTTSDPFPWYLPPDNQLPESGLWFWRVRGVKGAVLGAWSPARSFTVNTDHATRPVQRPLTPQSPLFTIEASKVTDFTHFQPDFPADLNPYLGIIAEGYVDKGLTITQFVAGLERLPNPFLIRSHPPTWVALPDLEWVCQHLPNFAGIQGGETLSTLYAEARGQIPANGDADYHRRMLRICAKYGKIYQEADGTYRDDKWQDLLDKQGPFIREYGRWLVLSQKNNIIRRQFYSQSAALGLWLGGLTHQHGAWEDGGFYWQNAGFGELGECKGERSGVLRTMPRIFWDLVFVMGIGRGCGIYSLDGQTLMVSPKELERFPKEIPRAIIWQTTGATTEVFKRYVVPLLRGIVQHGLIPTKEQVLQNVHLAVFNDMQGRGDVTAWPHYAEYGPLYAGTYGFRKMGNIDGQLFEFFPNTGRYYFIPALPQGNAPLGPGIRNLPLSQLQDPAQVAALFNAAYPQTYAGDALVCRVGDTLTVLNSHENEDVTEAYALPLNAGPVTQLAGRIGPHAYLVGKLEDSARRLWLQSNTEYPEREVGLEFSCVRKPQWQVVPPSAAKQAAWDAAENRLTLRLSHQQGAVEVTVW